MKTNQNRINSPMGLRICLYVMLLAFGSCSSCKKDVDPLSKLPAETQTGANTAGALIDGVAWIPNGNNNPIPAIRPLSGGYIAASLYRPKNCVSLRMVKNDRTGIDLFVKSVDKPGRYPLSFDTGLLYATQFPQNYGIYTIDGLYNTDPDYNYITTSIRTGYVNFTVADTTNKLLAGTFEFDAIDNPSGKTIKVTGGRFDINQKTLNP